MTDGQEEMLDAVLDMEDRLSGWELEFIESLTELRDENPHAALTPSQAEKLREIYEDKYDD